VFEPRVAVVGATGAVGNQLLRILEERKFGVSNLRLLASKRSAGTEIEVFGDVISVSELREDSFENIDIAFSAAGTDVARWFAPHAVKSGATVIDKSSAWRYEDDVPLVVPEINGQDLESHEGIISCPNCSTIQLVMALNPIHLRYPIRRVITSTYQAVSGAGALAMEELRQQTSDIVKGEVAEVNELPQQIAHNVIPEVETFREEDGYTSEEWKMAVETRKIMHEPNLPISATCVRVPVFRGHSEAVNLEFDNPVDPDSIRQILRESTGIVVLDDPASHIYPTPLMVEGKDEVLVGRIRRDASNPNGIVMWVVGDNLRKGAATNAVQIAEKIVR